MLHAFFGMEILMHSTMRLLLLALFALPLSATAADDGDNAAPEPVVLDPIVVVASKAP